MDEHTTPHLAPGSIGVMADIGVWAMQWGAGLAGAAVLLRGPLRPAGQR